MGKNIMTKFCLILAAAVVLSAGCVAPATKAKAMDQGRLATLQKDAEGGSAVAAYRLFLLSAGSDARALKYLRLAADRYVPAMSTLGAILLESDDAADRADGEKLLRMAALSGDVDAKKFLELRGIKW